jgi:hypothetical protein
MSYQNVVDKIQENNLSWNDIDRILLNPDTYKEFQERASFDTTDHYTGNAPAVRETDGKEQIIYVSPNGMEVTINI